MCDSHRPKDQSFMYRGGVQLFGEGGGAILCVLKGIVTVWTRCKVDQQILLLCTE